MMQRDIYYRGYRISLSGHEHEDIARIYQDADLIDLIGEDIYFTAEEKAKYLIDTWLDAP